MEGFGVGLCAGMDAGNGSGPRSAHKKIKRQLNATIDSGELPVLNKNGEPMSAETIIELLQDKDRKSVVQGKSVDLGGRGSTNTTKV